MQHIAGARTQSEHAEVAVLQFNARLGAQHQPAGERFVWDGVEQNDTAAVGHGQFQVDGWYGMAAAKSLNAAHTKLPRISCNSAASAKTKPPSNSSSDLALRTGRCLLFSLTSGTFRMATPLWGR